jgi:hypothetical protein
VITFKQFLDYHCQKWGKFTALNSYKLWKYVERNNYGAIHHFISINPNSVKLKKKSSAATAQIGPTAPHF